jgi:flagellar basal-body rod protein FlgG
VQRETEAPSEQFDLGVAEFLRPKALKEEGGNLFSMDPEIDGAYINVAGAGRVAFVKQGALEMSNVDLTEEMTNLLTSQRSYQMNDKAVTLVTKCLA